LSSPNQNFRGFGKKKERGRKKGEKRKGEKEFGRRKY
jgi:hypothetical protein